MSQPQSPGLSTITLGGGCFWCTEAVFDSVRGITDVESGYCNGEVVRPRYEQVCTGSTGHAEVVRLTFDPAVSEYDRWIVSGDINDVPAGLKR